MAKYKIALMPGDGIGNDVMDAAQIVLDKIGLDAEYVQADIGWEFWRTEGEPLPQRTVDTLKGCNCALFAAITSKPKEEAEAELVPELQGQGLVYRSPIVRLRQMFDLYVNLRPCKAFKGNPLNYRDDVDMVVFRENTQGLYAGVEFHPLPGEVRAVLEAHSPRMAAFSECACGGHCPFDAHLYPGRVPPHRAPDVRVRQKVRLSHGDAGRKAKRHP